jgi:hypothetical protein
LCAGQALDFSRIAAIGRRVVPFHIFIRRPIVLNPIIID